MDVVHGVSLRPGGDLVLIGAIEAVDNGLPFAERAPRAQCVEEYGFGPGAQGWNIGFRKSPGIAMSQRKILLP
jgi:hypothetical protein